MSAIERQILEQVKKNDALAENVFAAVKKRQVVGKDLEKLKPEVLATLILDFGKVIVSSNKLMTSAVDKIEQLKIKNMEKYENHFKKMDDVINKLENLSDVVSNAQEAVSKVEGNVEVMNKAAEALTLKENDVTSSLKSYSEVTQEFVNKTAKATKKSVEQVVPKAVEKNVLKQALAESKQEDERLRSVIVSGLSDRMGPDEMRSDLDNILETIDMRKSRPRYSVPITLEKSTLQSLVEPAA